jgi:class 3 adenylate cyclase
MVLEEGNIFGDSVNIASRIESLGVPGAVLLSETVNNQISNHPQFKTASLGKFEFKNVKKPIEVFALANEGFLYQREKIWQVN